MRKYGIPVVAVMVGIGIGLLIATPRTLGTAEAAREFSIAAVPVEKGGSDVFGPYDVVLDWPRPMSASLPGHENWTWGSAEGIFAESPERVFGFQRGELPLMDEPEPRPVPGFGHGISFPMNFGGGVPSYVRNASGGSPGGGRYRGTLGVDARWEHNIVVFNREGNIIEADVWTKWDSMFRRPHAVHINPYDPEKHIWFVDDAAHAVYKFSNDGRTLVQTLGTPYESGDDGKHFNRPTFLAWLPDSTLFVAGGYANTRVAKFDAQGNYLMSWGQRGSQEESHESPPDTRPGYFNTVHGVVVDPETRRVFVNDRNNRRVQMFDENGGFLDQWSWKDISCIRGVWRACLPTDSSAPPGGRGFGGELLYCRGQQRALPEVPAAPGRKPGVHNRPDARAAIAETRRTEGNRAENWQVWSGFRARDVATGPGVRAGCDQRRGEGRVGCRAAGCNRRSGQSGVD